MRTDVQGECDSLSRRGERLETLLLAKRDYDYVLGNVEQLEQEGTKKHIK